MQERFVAESAGGMDWPPLAQSTINARRAGRRTKGTEGAQKQTRAGAARRLHEQIQKHDATIAKAVRGLNLRKKSPTLKAQLAVNKRVHKLQDKIDAKRVKAANLSTMAGISILRDTGVLLAALSPTFDGKPGQLEDHIPFGVRVGYGGPGAHGKGRATVADIASFHQMGSGHLPKRTVIVPPAAPTLQLMRSDMDTAVARMAAETGNGR
jgi:hypothetical protein